jgi:hypothetical protein
MKIALAIGEENQKAPGERGRKRQRTGQQEHKAISQVGEKFERTQKKFLEEIVSQNHFSLLYQEYHMCN